MSLSDRDVERLLETVAKQVADIHERQERVFSPEHVAEMMGFASIKAVLDEIRDGLRSIKAHLGLG